MFDLIFQGLLFAAFFTVYSMFVAERAPIAQPVVPVLPVIEDKPEVIKVSRAKAIAQPVITVKMEDEFDFVAEYEKYLNYLNDELLTEMPAAVQPVNEFDFDFDGFLDSIEVHPELDYDALARLTVKQLRDMARGKVKGFMKLSKKELIAALL